MTYDSPNTINASKGIGELLTYVNKVSYNWVSNLLLVAIWIIFFMGYMRAKGKDDFVGASAIASYVTFVLATLLWIIGFVDGIAFGITIGVTVVATFFLLTNKKPE